MEAPVSTLVSRQRIPTALTSVSTLQLQPTSYRKPWRTNMVQYMSVTHTVPLTCSVLHIFFQLRHPALQVGCWCIASWASVDRPLWSWHIWCCDSASHLGTPWGTWHKNGPSILTTISCRSSLSWTNGWRSNDGCVLFSDLWSVQDLSLSQREALWSIWTWSVNNDLPCVWMCLMKLKIGASIPYFYFCTQMQCMWNVVNI